MWRTMKSSELITALSYAVKVTEVIKGFATSKGNLNDFFIVSALLKLKL